jgi:primase-polymerase (primpol)-like protein|uniref:hypothetical protein n=1 Tax=Polynucleobacter sp. TaxID=2029855 RepID=UPI004047CA7E
MSNKTFNTETQISEPDWLEPDFESIPEELKKQPWAVWKAEPRKGQPGKYNKAPINPLTGYRVGADKPELFCTYEEAKNAYGSGGYTGVGVLLTGNGITGIDIDSAVDLLKEKPEIKKWLKQAKDAGAYCEISPSQTGIRVFILGTIGGNGRNGGGLEIYDDKRFLTVTGKVLGGKK